MWVEFVVGYLLCSREVIRRVLRSSPLLKNQHFQIKILSGKHGHNKTSSQELQSVNKNKKINKKINYNYLMYNL